MGLTRNSVPNLVHRFASKICPLMPGGGWYRMPRALVVGSPRSPESRIPRKSEVMKVEDCWLLRIVVVGRRNSLRLSRVQVWREGSAL